MYLSRLALAPGALSDREFLRAFENPYSLHQALWGVFSDDPDRRRDFLYRLDLDARRPRIYALSARQPAADPNRWRIETQVYRPVLSERERLTFSVRVNPVITRNGKRHDIVMDAKRALVDEGIPRPEWPSQAELVQAHGGAWLERRAEKLGVRLDPTRLRADLYQVHRFTKPSGGRVQFATCDIQGVLQVTHPDKFLAAIENGIGPAKGFGCGLMLIKRSST